MDLSEYKVIGNGNTAEIYSKDDKKIVKLFRKGMGKKGVLYEFKMCQLIQRILDNVPKAYEFIEYEGRYGIVYERLFGQDMLKAIMKSLFKVDSYSRKLAKYHLDIHKTVDEDMSSVKEKLINDINAAEVLSEEYKDIIKRYLEELPDGNKLCHFDFHPRNIILINDEPYIIDWMTACKGASSADTARTLILIEFGEIEHMPVIMKKILTILKKRIGKVYIKEYLKISGESMEDINKWKMPIAAARLREWLTDNEKEKLLKFVKEECNRMKLI